jgi:hypothetical protein
MCSSGVVSKFVLCAALLDAWLPRLLPHCFRPLPRTSMVEGPEPSPSRLRPAPTVQQNSAASPDTQEVDLEGAHKKPMDLANENVRKIIDTRFC